MFAYSKEPMIIIPTNLDLNFVTHRVATGGSLETRDNLKELKALGITHIINARSEFNDATLFTRDMGFNYLWNGVDDDGHAKPVEWFKRAIDFALPALALPGTKIYAHCQAGINRGPSLAYAILRAQGMDTLWAKNLIQLARPIAFVGYAKDADDAIKSLGYE